MLNVVTVRQIYILTIISLIIPFTVTHTCHHTFQTSLVGSSPFRERLGSNRLPEKPRPRFAHAYVDDFSIVALRQISKQSSIFEFLRFPVGYPKVWCSVIFHFCLVHYMYIYRKCSIWLVDFLERIIILKCYVFSLNI